MLHLGGEGLAHRSRRKTPPCHPIGDLQCTVELCTVRCSRGGLAALLVLAQMVRSVGEVATVAIVAVPLLPPAKQQRLQLRFRPGLNCVGGRYMCTTSAGDTGNVAGAGPAESLSTRHRIDPALHDGLLPVWQFKQFWPASHRRGRTFHKFWCFYSPPCP